MLNRFRCLSLGAALALAMLPARAAALDRICDPAFENCRTPLLSLIDAETVGIDVAFWFMEDSRYSTRIIARWNAGVPVRVLMDTESTGNNTSRAATIQALRNAGIPMREKTGSGIMHWKMMLFVGQNTVQFSGANYSGAAFVYNTQYSDYVDEIIYFTDTPSIVNSFKTKYDDVWTTTSGYTNYANVTTLARHYPTFTLDPELNFPPYQNFRTRSVARYNAENTRIDAIIYRITDRAHTDALIAARGRGVPIRLISEPLQYRDETRLWHSWNIDRLYMAGVQIKNRGHAGLTHEKLTLLHGQSMAVFGSSNWTSASASSQLEHNWFTTDSIFFNWAEDHFNRKWNNTGGAIESATFTPLPPDTPSLRAPTNGATGQATSVTLRWYAGPWAHKYDVYLGTSTSNMAQIVTDQELGPSETSSDLVTWQLSNLVSGTTYFWRVVSRTMANQSRNSVTWSFTVGGSAPPPPSNLPSPWASQDIGSAGGSASYSSGTFTASGAGPDIWAASDELRFVYRTLNGNGTVTARVATLTGGSSSLAKAGVMIRETLSPGSKHATLVVTRGGDIAFLRRNTTGGSTVYTDGGAGTAPYWLRLTRSGSTLTAARSTNGTTWTTIGSSTVSMTTNVFIGLAVTSGSSTSIATATFTNVSPP